MGMIKFYIFLYGNVPFSTVLKQLDLHTYSCIAFSANTACEADTSTEYNMRREVLIP